MTRKWTRRRQLDKIICDSCGDKTPFIPTNNNQKRHSRAECRKRADKKRKTKNSSYTSRLKPLPMIVCDSCNDKTPFRATAYHQKRHQTKKCRSLRQRKYYTTRNKPYPMVICDSCEDKTPFQATSHNQKRHDISTCRNNNRKKYDFRGDRVIICQACGLPLVATNPNQKLHLGKDGDCYKYYRKQYLIDRVWKAKDGQEFRYCLKCEGRFVSTSPTHRLCHRCSINNIKLRYQTNSVSVGVNHV